jgi:hypothetical protein
MFWVCREESQIVAALCGNLNTQHIAVNRVRGVAMVRQPNLSRGTRCSNFAIYSSGTASTDPPQPKSEENENTLILLGRFKAAA